MMNPKNISEAREIANTIKTVEGVSDCIADDWNDYGNFSLIATLNMTKKSYRGWFPFAYPSSNFNLRKVNNQIKKILKDYNYKLEAPRREYETSGDRSFIGYSRNYIQINLFLL